MSALYGLMELFSTADPTAENTPERRERVEAIKREMVDAERGTEFALLREAQGLTTAQVAEAMGITHDAVGRIENCQTRMTVATLAAYLKAVDAELTISATVGNVTVRL